jgi:putative toxin-antitoxin system antitoxin component (TIGR02293 family)
MVTIVKTTMTATSSPLADHLEPRHPGDHKSQEAAMGKPMKGQRKSNPHELGAENWGGVMHKYVADNPVGRHRRVMQGVASKDFAVVLKTFSSIPSDELLRAMGISGRTLLRKQDDRLNAQHSNAAIALMEVTEQATRVLGSREAAEKWLSQKAVALEDEKPMNLLCSAPGIEAIKELLTRIEYGVYA